MLNLSDQTPTAICRRDSSFCRAGGAEVASATVKEARSKAMVMVIFMGGMDQFTRQIVSKLHLSLAERCDEPRLRLAGRVLRSRRASRRRRLGRMVRLFVTVIIDVKADFQAEPTNCRHARRRNLESSIPINHIDHGIEIDLEFRVQFFPNPNIWRKSRKQPLDLLVDFAFFLFRCVEKPGGLSSHSWTRRQWVAFPPRICGTATKCS